MKGLREMNAFGPNRPRYQNCYSRCRHPKMKAVVGDACWMEERIDRVKVVRSKISLSAFYVCYPRPNSVCLSVEKQYPAYTLCSYKATSWLDSCWEQMSGNVRQNFNHVSSKWKLVEHERYPITDLSLRITNFPHNTNTPHGVNGGNGHIANAHSPARTMHQYLVISVKNWFSKSLWVHRCHTHDIAPTEKCMTWLWIPLSAPKRTWIAMTCIKHSFFEFFSETLDDCIDRFEPINAQCFVENWKLSVLADIEMTTFECANPKQSPILSLWQPNHQFSQWNLAQISHIHEASVVLLVSQTCSNFLQWSVKHINVFVGSTCFGESHKICTVTTNLRVITRKSDADWKQNISEIPCTACAFWKIMTLCQVKLWIRLQCEFTCLDLFCTKHSASNTSSHKTRYSNLQKPKRHTPPCSPLCERLVTKIACQGPKMADGMGWQKLLVKWSQQKEGLQQHLKTKSSNVSLRIFHESTVCIAFFSEICGKGFQQSLKSTSAICWNSLSTFLQSDNVA